MKIHILGSCCGAEPIPGRRHTAWVLEADGVLYWFDAGEGCSYTAHMMGLDLLSVKSVFISHPHIDHVGGLANLMFSIGKLSSVKATPPKVTDKIKLFTPDMSHFEAISRVAEYPHSYLYDNCKFDPSPISDGEIYRDKTVSVEALHNSHLGDTPVHKSFSYRIKVKDKTLLYTGDVDTIADIDDFLKDGCDVLLTETGHHKPESIPLHIKEKSFDVKKIIYVHNGRAIINHPEESAAAIREAWGDSFHIANDGDTIIL